MTTYSIGSPPSIPGIYLLTHEPTKRKYVGQALDLRRRLNEWRWTFSAGGVHSRNRKLFEAIAGTAAKDWSFTVLHEALDPADLDRLEQHAIQMLVKASPKLVLNQKGVQGKPLVKKGEGNKPLTQLLDEEGNTIPYRTAANALGVCMQAVSKRLAVMREQGITKVKLCSENKKLLPA